MDGNKLISPLLRLHVWGDNACFSRPEMKVERVSYDVLTPSAARGILEAIHWKPAIAWDVLRIDVLKPIKWESVRRNEVGVTMSSKTGGLFIEDQRQQRAGVLLKDVAYVIHARIAMTERAGSEDNLTKHVEMFQRRAEKGQCFHRPYLGCREFAANFRLIPPDETPPEPEEKTAGLGYGSERDLGWMLRDIIHGSNSDAKGRHVCNDECHARFFRACLKEGSLKVEPLAAREVLA